MKSNVTGLAIVCALLLIGSAAGLFAYQTGSAEAGQQTAEAGQQTAEAGRTIAVYKSPT